MKELTQDEVIDRMMALQRATKIFIESGLTNNITHAFIAYQAIFAEREREIFLSTQIHGNKQRTVMDRYERPKCECGAEMMFRIVPPNDEGIKCQLVCSNENCDTVLDSENEIEWWMRELKVKDEYSRISQGTEKVEQDTRYSGDRRRLPR